jgi:tRNA G18 (ribose-2'-O)-methylase SpoU
MDTAFERSVNWNVVDSLKTLPVETIREMVRKDRLPYSVMLLNVRGDLNVGMIVRTALLCGASGFHLLGNSKMDRRSTVGAHHYFPKYHVRTSLFEIENSPHTLAERLIEYFRENFLVPVFCENFPSSVSVFSSEFSDKIRAFRNRGVEPCFVFGEESLGIPTAVLKAAFEAIPESFVVSIPQRLPLRSFNVSASAAIILSNVANIM